MPQEGQGLDPEAKLANNGGYESMARKGIVSISTSGDMKHVNSFFKKVRQRKFVDKLEKYAQMGVEALALETPVDTGRTAASWGYEITQEKGRITLSFTNSATAGDTSIPIVLLIQYGHATRNGGYVAPYDFINPVTEKIFKEIADSIWKEVTRE